MTVTTYLAALTTRTQLGISVLVLPKRSPVLVAKGAATLDVLNGGRLVLGVGAGYHELQFRWLGGELRRYYPFSDAARGEYEAWKTKRPGRDPSR